MLDKTIDTLFNEVPDETFTEQHADNNKTYTGELIGKDKNVIPINISRGKISGKDSTVEGYVFVASDISSEKRAQQKFRNRCERKRFYWQKSITA